MTHTPGPWEFVPAGNRPEIMAERGKVLVCRVESLRFVDDARLIAAAPDLLEALKRLTAEAAKNIYPKPDVGPDHPFSILKQAEAAIAKAEGRT